VFGLRFLTHKLAKNFTTQSHCFHLDISNKNCLE